MRSAADFAIFAVTSTLARSSAMRTPVTWPMLTSLYLTNVLPASMPSADLNVTVIVGPSLAMRCTAIPIATSAATMGTIQIGEKRARRGGTATASGRSSAGSATVFRRPIPYQPRIEGFRGEHRQHDDGHEVHHARSRLDRHQGSKLDQRYDVGVDEDV